MQVPTGWTGSVATCTVGTESPASIDATLATINALRDYAGMQPVTFDATLHARSLAAALMMSAAGELSHTPGPTWPCYTADGAQAAGRSNLSLGRSGAAAMVGYVEDPGVASLGHRRWLLDPHAQAFATGSTNDSNVLFTTIPRNGLRPGPEVLAWPPAGFLPWELFFPVWSAQVNTTEPVDLGGATVTVTVDGQPREVGSLARLGSGYGATGPALSWTVPITDEDRSVDRKIKVTLSNVLVSGNPREYSYELVAVQANPQPAPEPTPTPAPTPSPPSDPPTTGPAGPPAAPVFTSRARIRRSGRRLTAVATARDASRLSYQWLRNGRPIRRATKRRYRLTRRDRGRRLSCRVTAIAETALGSSSATTTSKTVSGGRARRR